MAGEGGGLAPPAHCRALPSAPVPVHLQSKLVDGRRSPAALDGAPGVDQASSPGGCMPPHPLPPQVCFFGTLPRSSSSSPSPARCRDQPAITPAAALPRRRCRAYLLHTIAPQPAVPRRLGTSSVPRSGLCALLRALLGEPGRSPLHLLQPPPGREARERAQLITRMLPARAGAGRGWDFLRAAKFKGVPAPRSCTHIPTGCKISRGPHGAAPGPQPADREAVGPTITRRSGSQWRCQWWYPWWEGQGFPVCGADPSLRLTRSTLTPAIAPRGP